MNPIKYLLFSILAFAYSYSLVVVIYDIRITFWEAQAIMFILTLGLLVIGWLLQNEGGT